MDDRNQNGIILSFVNDCISVPINKTLELLYKNDYKEYKKFFVCICARLQGFKDELVAEGVIDD